MRCSKLVVVVAVWAAGLWAQSPGALKTQIGIFPLGVPSGDQTVAAPVLEAIKANLAEVGGYEIHTHESMHATFDRIKQRFPDRCDDPGCASAVGSALQMDRMIYGGADKTEKSWAVWLVMLDVPSRQIIESVRLEGKDGVAMGEVVRVAVRNLHEQEVEGSDKLVRPYYGREVRKGGQLLVAAPVCIATGLIWGAANGSLGGRDEDDRVAETIDPYDGKLYGVAAGEDQIALFGRPGALANTYVAESNDAYGVFFNPAGLPWAKATEVAMGYQYRFGLNSFAGSFVSRATRDLGYGEGIFYCGDSLAGTMYFFSSIGYRFNQIFSWMGPLSLGATVKLKSFKLSDPTSADAVTGSAFGFGLNLGMQLQVSDQIRGGILFKNVPMVMTNHNTYTDESYSETDAPLMLVGGTFEANYATLLICEVRMPLNDNQPWRFAGAVERLMFRVIRARLGIAREADYGTPWQFTGGLGIDMNMNRGAIKYAKLDGSYEFNTVRSFAHVVNVSLRFGF